MPKSLIAVLAMIRYELLMSWRGGSTRVALLVIALMPLLGYFSFVAESFKQADEIAQLTAEGALWYRTAMTIADTFFLIPVMVFLIPILFAETIPLDRQRRVRELIAALPLPRGGYLAGKLLPVWVALTAAVTIAAGINLGMSLAYRGPFAAGPVALLWIAGIWLATLFASQMGVTLAAGQPDRRRAILIGALGTLPAAGGVFLLPTADVLWAAFIQSAFIVGHPTIDISRYPAYPDFASPALLGRIGLALAIMAATWAAAALGIEKAET